jgi:hypothetical protein
LIEVSTLNQSGDKAPLWLVYLIKARLVYNKARPELPSQNTACLAAKKESIAGNNDSF